MLKRIFYNSQDKRLRAGWRILLFIIILVSLSLLFQTLLKMVFGGIPKTSTYLRNSIAIFMAFLATNIAVPISRKWLDRESLKSLGLNWSGQALKDILFGFFLSAAMAGLFFGLAYSFGYLSFEGINWGNPADPEAPDKVSSILSSMGVATLLFYLMMDIIVSWWEELVFRGYLFQNLEKGIGLVLAVTLSCVLYGMVHYSNPNAGPLSTLIIMAFGFLRLYGYLSTRQLWLSFGMHVGWNFFQGPVFGFNASGNETTPLIIHETTGPDYLSGGAFGPEGSLLVLPVVALSLWAMYAWVKIHYPELRNNWILPRQEQL